MKENISRVIVALALVGAGVFCLGLLGRAVDRSLQAEYNSLAHYHSAPGGSYTSPCFVRHRSER